MTARTRIVGRPTDPASGMPTARRPPALTLGIAVVAAVAAAAALPWLLGAYPISVASYALAFALLATSTHLLAMAGLPSLGQAAYFGIGAYTAASCARTLTTVGPLQLLTAATVAATAAAAVAPLLVRTRAIAFLLATWALAELAHTAADHATTITGGGNGLTTPPITVLPGLPPLTRDGHIYLYTLACTIIIGGIVAVALRSRGTLIVRGIADNEPRLRASGHNVTWHLTRLYITAAALAGAAGSLFVATRHYIGPGDHAFDVNALALLAAIIGRNSVLGAAGAAILIVATRDIAATQTATASPILLGILFLAAALTRTTDLAALRHARPRTSRSP